MINRKILYIVSSEKFFISHRLEVALAAKRKGYQIHLASNSSKFKNFFNSKGFYTHNILNKNTNSKIILFFLNFINTIKIINKISPDIVQIITIFNIFVSNDFIIWIKRSDQYDS